MLNTYPIALSSIDPRNLFKIVIIISYCPSVTAGTIAGIVLSVIALVAALLYFRDPDKRACLRSCINPFSLKRGRGRVQYCRVRYRNRILYY